MTHPIFWAPLIALTAVLAWMSWDLYRVSRAHRRYERETGEALALTQPLRCLVCPGQPDVAHSRLFHHPARTPGPEDSPRWTA